MPITKHKIFKLKLSDDSKLEVINSTEKVLSDFLSNPNIVYLNHSITTLTEDVEKYDTFKTVSRFLLISLIYKDLNETSLDIRSTSKKVKSLVHKQVKSGEKINEPLIETELDKQIKELSHIQNLKSVISTPKKS